MKKILIFLLFIFNLAAVYYLLLPFPSLPTLPNSLTSDLPGDTTQIANVSAYYTNSSRADVIGFYQKLFPKYFTIHLNHPPERAKDVIRDTTQSYYLEEFILPFKGSLFVNGYEWQNDVFTKPEKRAANKLIFKDQLFNAKITLKTYPVSIPKRLLAFFATEIAFGLIIFLYRHV